MTRFFGPRGSRRRLGSLLAAIISATLLGIFVALPAQAVHDIGVFQLDGDAQQATSPPGSNSTVGDDWDNICASNSSTCTFQNSYTASPSTTATASAHNSDTQVIAGICGGGTNCTVFTGGGSKDPQDLSNWKWKTDSGGLPSKDNLAHSFAARYSHPSTGPSDPNCPAPTAGTDTCKLLYFGSDRIDNSGDAQEGFWFFQNPVKLNTNGTFSQLHAVGDLLILSDFSVGGTTSTINIYKWVASGGDVSTHLQSLGGGTNSACDRVPPLPSPDPFCGIVNRTDGTIAPWTFTDKSGNSTYLTGELYEGGVNLSSPTINLGGECFASFASETRSSVSPTATLKDFVLGGFGQCTSGTVTTPEDSSGTSISGGSVSIGTGSVQVKDHAVVTGVGSTTKPTGTVTFYICGPASSDALAQCEAAVEPNPSPPSNGTLVSTNALSPDGGNSSTADSDLTTITAVGHYCFRGDYSGDSLFPASSDNALTECFTVTDTSSVLTDQTWVPNDHAKITSTGGSALDGSVVFTLYDNGTCDGNVLYSNSTPIAVSGSSPQIVDSNNATHVNASTTVSWKVVYTSNNANTGSTSSCESTALTIDNNPGYTPLP